MTNAIVQCEFIQVLCTLIPMHSIPLSCQSPPVLSQHIHLGVILAQVALAIGLRNQNGIILGLMPLNGPILNVIRNILAVFHVLRCGFPFKYCNYLPMTQFLELVLREEHQEEEDCYDQDYAHADSCNARSLGPVHVRIHWLSHRELPS